MRQSACSGVSAATPPLNIHTIIGTKAWMITASFGSSSRTNADADESWVNQHVNGRLEGRFGGRRFR